MYVCFSYINTLKCFLTYIIDDILMWEAFLCLLSTISVATDRRNELSFPEVTGALLLSCWLTQVDYHLMILWFWLVLYTYDKTKITIFVWKEVKNLYFSIVFANISTWIHEKKKKKEISELSVKRDEGSELSWLKSPGYCICPLPS